MFAAIRTLIDQEARLLVPASDLSPHADLYALGLTPYSAVRLLLALERDFDVEFPREALKRETMGSLAAIAHALAHATPRSVRRDAA
jgi:acyl carrier protein